MHSGSCSWSICLRSGDCLLREQVSSCQTAPAAGHLGSCSNRKSTGTKQVMLHSQSWLRCSAAAYCSYLQHVGDIISKRQRETWAALWFHCVDSDLTKSWSIFISEGDDAGGRSSLAPGHGLLPPGSASLRLSAHPSSWTGLSGSDWKNPPDPREPDPWSRPGVEGSISGPPSCRTEDTQRDR